MMSVHHEAIHKKNKVYWITSILTCGWYLKPFHKIHHDEFLENVDDFSWARTNESFYKFFYRTHLKRRLLAGWKSITLDILTFIVMTYFFDWYYVVMIIGFTFHWELFEYWSHYSLKERTNNKYWWSWNVVGKIFNTLTLGVGLHSKHHTYGEGYFPTVYSNNLYEAYLPLLPNKFYPYMEKQIKLNKERGIL
jgi:hypothetical protein